MFAGVGGLELGAEMAFRACGYKAETVYQIENNPFSAKVLARHWPNARRFGDITTVDARYLPKADLCTIGFPCTDLSTAGKQEGIFAARSGLWFESKRILGATRPALILIENINHGREGWLPYVLSDLKALGYEGAPYRLAASDLGAPHERARTFVLATYADRESLRQFAERVSRRRTGVLRRPWESESVDDGYAWFAAVSRCFSAPPKVSGVDDGVSRRVDAGRVDPTRSDSAERNMALGNAVSPPVAYAVTLELIRLFEERVGA